MSVAQERMQRVVISFIDLYGNEIHNLQVPKGGLWKFYCESHSRGKELMESMSLLIYVRWILSHCCCKNEAQLSQNCLSLL